MIRFTFLLITLELCELESVHFISPLNLLVIVVLKILRPFRIFLNSSKTVYAFHTVFGAFHLQKIPK